tara:strand:+ start:127 stop:603 length:477 start_codon:yes stop_codon:yes gene_type:complete
MKIIKKSILILSLLLTMSCGFKVLDKSNTNNFTINEINTSGNSRINYKIKNYLLSNTQKNNTNVLSINMETKIKKRVKEKNIKNEITKYEIDLNTNINTYSIENNRKNDFNLSVAGDYSVDTKNYSGTINNEKNLINNLTEKLAENILKEINKTINDF